MKQLYRILFLFVLIMSFNQLNASVVRGYERNEKSDLNHEISTLVTPTATIATSANSVCQNTASPVITFSGSGGTAPYTFTYTLDGATKTITTATGDSVTLLVPTTSAGILNYTLVSVHDSTNPTIEITQTGTVTITITPSANADLNSSATTDSFNGFPVFKVCSNQSTLIEFFNTSTTKSTNTNYTINWGDGTPNFTSNDWNKIDHNYSVGLWTLVYSIVGQNGCTITKSYKIFIGNNPAVGLGNPGNTDICITSSLTFPITGTENNPPGTTYTVSFNDGSLPITYNHPPPSSVTHTFLKTSCGTTSTVTSTYNNSFFASIVAENPCDKSAATVVPIRVSTIAVPSFQVPQTIKCTGNQICITNTSTGGDSASSSSCSNPKIIWTISPSTGFTLASGSLGDDFGSANTNSWISGSNSICPIFSVAGTYSITMKIGNRCGIEEITKTICIESPLVPQFTLNNSVSCAPASIGTTNTTVETNLCTATTYLWNVTYTNANCGTSISPITDQTTKDATYNFTVPGTHSLKLTATNSCGSVSTSQTVTIKKPPTISAINGILSNYCGPTTINPTVTVNACTPSTGTLSYAWSFPGGTPAVSTTPAPGPISYTAAGTYTVSLIVTNECGDSTPFTKTFTISDVPVITTTPLAQTVCSGTATSAVSLTADLPNTTYTWTATATAGITGFVTSGTTNIIPSQTIANATSTAGTVTYVITPSVNGCSGTTVNYVITVNPGPSIATQPISSTLCLGGTPSMLAVTLNNTSGNPTYQWYSNTANNTMTGTAISNETNSSYLPPASAVGTTYYYCVITLTSGGCSSLKSAVASVTIVDLANITTQPMASQNLCVGVTIPSALSVSYSGGTGTPTYQWFINTTNSTTGGTAIPGATNSTYTPPVFTLASIYFYYVTITLSGTSCGNLTSSVAEIIVDNDPTIATQPLNSQTVCQNATPTDLSVTLSGGSGTYSYQWYSNLVNSATSGTIINGATSSIYSPLTTLVGTKYYYCVITQNGVAGCTVTSATASVSIASAPVFTTQPSSSTICLGQSTPPLSVAYANGTGSAQYQWFSNSSNSNIGGTSIASATSMTFQPVSSPIGTTYYYCIITFPSLAAGCGVITSNVAQVIVNPKATITSEIATICSGAPFTIVPANVSGNIVPVGTTYTWTNPIISPIGSVTGASAVAIAQTDISQTLINTTTSIATVVYTVTPTTGSCVGNTFAVAVTVNPATNPNAVKTDSTCFGINNGSITTSTSGGIPFSTGEPYIFSWTGPDDFNSSDPSITSLAPGTYRLSITDAGGCPVVNSYTINEPEPIIVTTDSITNISCFGSANGAIAITVIGGVGNYTYTWTKDGAPYAGADDISNLSAGNYVVTVFDTNNCVPATASFSITEPPVLVVSLVSKTNIDCYGASTGSIEVETVGGTITNDYTYLWSGPNGFLNNNQNLNNLKAGTYVLTVSDDLGCSEILSVNLTQSTEIEITAVTTPIVCYGDDNATIVVTLSGGNAPYQVQWSNLATGLNQSDLAPGNYTITVTDNLGCIKSKIINIPSPPIFTVNPVITQISCFGANDGSIKLNFVGGVSPVNLVWSDNSTAGTTRNNLKPGTYSVSIIDGTPCQITRTFIIVEPQVLVVDANITNALNCDNANSGAINLLVSGGTAPFSYAWSNGAVTEDLTAIPAGNYLVTVTDARNCSATASYAVVRPSPIVVKVDTATDFDCATKVVKQSFIAKVSGGIPPYQFVWSNGIVSGANDEIMNTSQNGLVLLEAIDARGCKTSYNFNVAVPELGTPSFATTSIGFNTYGFYSIEDPIQFTNTATGDFTNIAWDFGDGTFSNEENPIHIYKKEGTYIVRQSVTYPFGCVYVSTLTLQLEKGYRLIPPTGFTPNNDGINDYYAPEFLGLNQISFDIYDTWGSLIYSESGDSIRGWDGKINNKEAENGNYYFKITGKTFYGKIIKDQGPVVLIK